MRAGELRHRIELQRVTTSQDTYGEPDETWSTFAEPWARSRQMSGNERQANNVDLSTEAWVFNVRHLGHVKTLTPKDRIRYSARIFDIDRVNNVGERDREIEIIAHTVEYVGS